MLVILSPAKTLDYKTPLPLFAQQKPEPQWQSQPVFLVAAKELVILLKKMNTSDLATLMNLSDALAQLNVDRFANWSHEHPDLLRPCVYAYKGDVYEGLDIAKWNQADLIFAETTLRILSGLYGVLKPTDVIFPYRLEMGTNLANQKGKNLYQFWGDRISIALNQALNEQEIQKKILLNLASEEYFGAVNGKWVDAKIIQPVFKDEKNGAYKVISFFAKKARGAMASWVIKNRLKDADDLKACNLNGYVYHAASSSDVNWVFQRSEKSRISIS